MNHFRTFCFFCSTRPFFPRTDFFKNLPTKEIFSKFFLKGIFFYFQKLWKIYYSYLKNVKLKFRRNCLLNKVKVKCLEKMSWKKNLLGKKMSLKVLFKNLFSYSWFTTIKCNILLIGEMFHLITDLKNLGIATSKGLILNLLDFVKSQ